MSSIKQPCKTDLLTSLHNTHLTDEYFCLEKNVFLVANIRDHDDDHIQTYQTRVKNKLKEFCSSLKTNIKIIIKLFSISTNQLGIIFITILRDRIPWLVTRFPLCTQSEQLPPSSPSHEVRKLNNPCRKYYCYLCKKLCKFETCQQKRKWT